MKYQRLSQFAFATFWFSLLLPAQAQDWAVWRGESQNGTTQTADGRFANAKYLKKNWQRQLGAGYSRLSAIGTNLIATFADQRSDWVGVFDTKTGDEKWRHKMGPMYRAHDGGHDGPLSTPVANAENVFALSAQGKLICLDLKTGKEKWTIDCPRLYGASEPFWGFCSTPCLFENLVIVPVSGRAESGIVAFNTRDGSVTWQVPFDRVEYRSPVIATINGASQLIAASDREVRGIDPKTGTTFWSLDYRSTNDMTPVVVSDNRVLLTGRGGVELIEISDSNKVSNVWQTRDFQGNYDTAVAYNGHIYGFTGNLLTCLDAESGQRKWRSRQPDGMALVIVDGQIVSFSARGHITLAPASSSAYDETCRLKVSSANGYASPIVADGQIFARDLKGEVFAVGVSDQPTELDSRVLPAGSQFAQLVDRLNAATDKSALIDRFLKSQSSFPVLEDNYVHFVYHGKAEDVAIEGSMLDSGEQDQLNRVPGSDFFYKSYEVEPGTRLEYRFIVDFDRRVADPLNERRAFENDSNSEVIFPGWSEPDFAKQTANADERDLKSLSTQAGNVQILLPVDYQSTVKKYPLVIVTEGSDWISDCKILPVLTHLESHGDLQAVVAFLPDGGNREMGGGNTDGFAKKLANEIIPAIESEFRISEKPSDRILLGKRGAAVASVYATLKYPEVIGKCIAISYGRADTVRADDILELMQKLENNKPEFIILWNRYEVSRPQSFDCRQQSRELSDQLKDHKYVVTSSERNDSSNPRSWRILAGEGIKHIFK